MKTLIKNGTLITAAETYPADILVDGEQIVLLGRDLPVDGAQVVDATGKYVTPGGIDVHTHLELPFGGTVSSDDFYTGHKAAAFGGTTSHIDFVIQGKGQSLHDAIEAWHRKADGKAVVDFGFHVAITDLTDAVMDEIPSVVSLGVTSLKLFMAYKNVLMVDDTTLFRALMKAAEAGMLIMVHAENGDVIDLLVKQARDRGNLSPVWHARTRPALAEAEATFRAVTLAGIAGAPLYVVHMTCQESVEMLTYGRRRGLNVMGETCTQYLFFTEDELDTPDGARLVCSPPMRQRKDNEYLWKAIADGQLQAVSTDHCPFFLDGTREIEYEDRKVAIPGKELGKDDFSKIPNGVPGIEDRQLILWTYGVGQGRISPNRFVELTATNPAKIFGMYPKKGTIAIGSDADLVIWDPAASKTMGVRTSHQRTDYNLYEGWGVTGLPEKVFVRGGLLVDGEAWNGEAGGGSFVQRNPDAPVL